MTIRIQGFFPAALLLGLAAAAASPAARADTSNCTVISAVPYVISAAGHYCMAGNLVFSSTASQAIKITASNVVLDCNGYAVDQTSTSNSAGVYFGSRTDVVIRGCTFRNFHRGIYILGGAPRSQRIELSGNTIVGARYVGINAQIRNGQVRDNRVIDTTGITAMRLMADGEGVLTVGGNTVRGLTGAGAGVSGLMLEGSGRAVVEDNSISAIGTAGNSSAYAIRLITAASVTPVPAVITGNEIYAPTAVTNIAISRSGTTARSRCVDNSIVGIKNGTQWANSNGCL